MRNPKWIRDEVVLALDLYFQLEPGQIHSKNPLIIKLSELLNELTKFALGINLSERLTRYNQLNNLELDQHNNLTSNDLFKEYLN